MCLNNINMNKIFYFVRIFAICALMLLCICTITLCYAQEQDIAESFGLYSKGIDYYHKGKLYEAKDTLEQAVRLDARNDEAQGYLDLVNAEINMREQGRLGSYQNIAEIKRESDRPHNELHPQLEPGPENIDYIN